MSLPLSFLILCLYPQTAPPHSLIGPDGVELRGRPAGEVLDYASWRVGRGGSTARSSPSPTATTAFLLVSLNSTTSTSMAARRAGGSRAGARRCRHRSGAMMPRSTAPPRAQGLLRIMLIDSIAAPTAGSSSSAPHSRSNPEADEHSLKRREGANLFDMVW